MRGLVLAILCALLAACAQSHGLAGLRPTIVIRNVNVVDVVRGRILPRHDVLIQGSVIAAIVPAAQGSAPGAAVIDGAGRFLIPGLWDMHVHSSSDRITREIFLPLYVANGITGVRDMKGDCFAPCTALESSVEQLHRWRADIAAGRLVGPEIIGASPLINSPRAGQPSTVQRPGTASDAVALVRLMQERRVDFLKVYSRLRPEPYFALAAEARRLNIPFAGHVPTAVRASEAYRAGQRSMEHLHGVIEECSSHEAELRPALLRALEGSSRQFAPLMEMIDSFSPEKCARLYRLFRAMNTWQVPTLVIENTPFAAEARDPVRLRFLPPQEIAWQTDYARRLLAFWPDGLASVDIYRRKKWEIVRAMNAAGVGLLAGSDTGAPFILPGFALHDELELLVRAGLTPAQALRAATLNPALFFGRSSEWGTVAAGRRADLVLLRANPLRDIRATRQIEGVLLRGRFFDRPALDRMLDQAQAAAAGSAS